MSAPEPGAPPAVPNLPGRPARARRAGPNPFEAGGEHYDAVRPSYPAAAVDRVLADAAEGADVVELGAGTGLFTRLLAARPADRVRTVTALEPSASMRAVLEREVAAGTGGRVRAV
ncbi:class I SAM-dependent methyltransferase, partial [Micrococcus luteus]|nr:class I SAM-dependent methyltransferase [Micrococcus luteus]